MGLTSDRNDPCIKQIRSDGMQECYLVLSQEELDKGFIRPVRRSYKHLKCGTVTTMAQKIAETYARNPKFYGGTYCVGCGTHFDLRSLNFDKAQGAHLQMLDGKPVLAWHFAWDPYDGSYVGE